jgi:hypothetical protein
MALTAHRPHGPAPAALGRRCSAAVHLSWFASSSPRLVQTSGGAWFFDTLTPTCSSDGRSDHALRATAADQLWDDVRRRLP